MGAAGLTHPLAKALLLAELLDNAHAVDNFVEAIVDIRQISPHATDNRRAVALVDNHHNHHRREDGHRHQRHAPLEAEHRHQHGADKGGAAQHRGDHRDIEIADHFRIVGDAGDDLPDGLGIEFAQRLAQGGIHYVGTQLLYHPNGGLVKQQRLGIVQSGRKQLQANIGHSQPGHQAEREIVLCHHIVDEIADQQRAGHFGDRRNPQQHHRQREGFAPRRAIRQQAFKGRPQL